MNQIAIAFSLALGAFMLSSIAQDTGASAANLLANVSREPLPSGTLIKRLPGYAKWRIAYSSASSPAESPEGNSEKPSPSSLTFTDLEHPREVLVTRTGSVWNAIQVMQQRQRVESWGVGQDKFIILPDQPVQLWEDTYNKVFGDYGRIDFPDVNWVSAGSYVGIQKTRSGEYLVFKRDDGKNGITVVWVDSTTRLPVRWQKGEQVRFMQVLPVPTQELAPPSDIQQAEKELKAMRERLQGRQPK